MKQIPLTQGQFALVDDEDYEILSKFKWHASKERRNWYALRRGNNDSNESRLFKMHRQILGLTDSKICIDHKDGNGLNNQKSNLRIATNSENQRNKKVQSNNKSGFKGVYFDKKLKKWRAVFNPNKKSIHIGCFHYPEDAARAYNEIAKKHYGEFARLNDV